MHQSAHKIGAADDPSQLSVAQYWHPLDPVGFQQRSDLGDGGIFGDRNDLSAHHVLRAQSVYLQIIQELLALPCIGLEQVEPPRPVQPVLR